MPDDHRQWEARAVAHVMGGMQADESSQFREHLLSCARCKAQVRELRELAGSLALAARQERSRQAGTVTELPEEPETEGREPITVSVRGLVIGVLVIGALVLLVFNNMSMRSRVHDAEQAAELVAPLGDGLVLEDVTRIGQVQGQVVVNESMVAWTFTNLPSPTTEQRLAVWLVDADGNATAISRSRLVVDGSNLAGRTNDPGARRLLITLTDAARVPGGSMPVEEIPGLLQVDADLSAMRGSDQSDGSDDQPVTDQDTPGG